jgi:CheY-like chemotaxis protein
LKLHALPDWLQAEHPYPDIEELKELRTGIPADRTPTFLQAIPLVNEDRERQKILIVGRESSLLGAIRILLGSRGYECTIVWSARQAQEALDNRDFDALVVYANSADSPAAEVISNIQGKYPDLLERTLVVAGEGSDPKIQDLIEQYSLSHLQAKFLVQQLCESLESLLHPRAAFLLASHTPRLIFDSFRDPVPAGFRSREPRGRRVLYASRSVRVDLWIEPAAGSDRGTLTGQILDWSEPTRRFDGASVALVSGKGPVWRATTNEYGEFHLDFEIQPKLSLRITGDKAIDLTIRMPAMGWPSRNASGSP